MFNIFKKAPAPTKPQLTDAEIKERAKAMAERMGSKYCAAKGSTFQYERNVPTVLGRKLDLRTRHG